MTGERVRDALVQRASGSDEPWTCGREAFADPRLLDVFQRFVALETELADLLATASEQDRQLLQQSRPS